MARVRQSDNTGVLYTVRLPTKYDKMAAEVLGLEESWLVNLPKSHADRLCGQIQQKAIELENADKKLRPRLGERLNVEEYAQCVPSPTIKGRYAIQLAPHWAAYSGFKNHRDHFGPVSPKYFNDLDMDTAKEIALAISARATAAMLTRDQPRQPKRHKSKRVF